MNNATLLLLLWVLSVTDITIHRRGNKNKIGLSKAE